MDSRLAQGAQVVQGQHVIRNPDDGWFPALTWAMFLIDNRIQNLGRSNLGWSAKNMGDSICFRADVLRRLGWGEGLTEDYQLRQRLLLAGIAIRIPILHFVETPILNLFIRTLGVSQNTAEFLARNATLALAVGIVMLWNFFINRYWTYNDVE